MCFDWIFVHETARRLSLETVGFPPITAVNAKCYRNGSHTMKYSTAAIICQYAIGSIIRTGRAMHDARYSVSLIKNNSSYLSRSRLLIDKPATVLSFLCRCKRRLFPSLIDFSSNFL